MAGQESESRDERGQHGTRDDHRDQKGILLLGYDVVREAIQGRDRSERQPGGHHQGVIPSLVAPAAELSDDRVESEYLRYHLPTQQEQKNNRGGNEGRQRNEGSRAKKIERGEKPDGQSPETASPEGVSGREFRQHHAHQIGGKHRFTPRPERQCTQAEKDENDRFGANRGSPTGVNAGQPPAR